MAVFAPTSRCGSAPRRGRRGRRTRAPGKSPRRAAQPPPHHRGAGRRRVVAVEFGERPPGKSPRRPARPPPTPAGSPSPHPAEPSIPTPSPVAAPRAHGVPSCGGPPLPPGCSGPPRARSARDRSWNPHHLVLRPPAHAVPLAEPWAIPPPASHRNERRSRQTPPKIKRSERRKPLANPRGRPYPSKQSKPPAKCVVTDTTTGAWDAS